MKKLIVIMVWFAIWGFALPYTWDITNHTDVPYNVEIYEIGKVAGSSNPKETVDSYSTKSIHTGGYLSYGYCITDSSGHIVFEKTWSKWFGGGGETLYLVKSKVIVKDKPQYILRVLKGKYV